MSKAPVNASEAAQRDFHERVHDRTMAAMRAAGTVAFHIRLAGHTIRLELAGPAMLQAKTTALAHLEVPPPDAPPDAVLRIWDSASTGIANVPPPWKNTAYSDRGDIWGFNSPRFLSAFHWGDFGLNLFDNQTGAGIYWTQDVATLPYWSRAAPLRTLLHWCMQRRGLQMMHSAAVGNEDGAILLVGRGGVGKSGTALSCLLSGMRFIGDDYLVVGLEPEPVVHALYATAKLHWDQLPRFPGLGDHLLPGTRRDDEKASVALLPRFRSGIAGSLKLRLVVTPEFSGEAGTSLSPVSGELLRGAASLTTVSQLPHGGQLVYQFVAEMIRRVPAATLRLGHDRAAIPAAIARFLRPPVRNMLESAGTQGTLAAPPLISVIIPVFNGAHFLADAMRSVRAQHYPNLEVIVVDDGSTDDLEAAVLALPMEVRFLRQGNRGPGAARNLGIKNATGVFLAFLDVDDLWPEDNLPALARYLREHPAVDVVRGHAQRMELDAASGTYRQVGNPLESFPDSIAAALFRAEVFQDVGLFDQSYHFGEDSDWFDRARARNLEIRTLDLVTLLVRRHGGNMTEGKNLSALHKLQLLKTHLDKKRPTP